MDDKKEKLKAWARRNPKAAAAAARGALVADPGQKEAAELCKNTTEKCTACGGYFCPSCYASCPICAVLKNQTHVCAICFAPPGIDCNSAPGWCGAVDAGAHARAPLANPCGACRGTGRYGTGLDTCPHCQGNRHSGGRDV